MGTCTCYMQVTGHWWNCRRSSAIAAVAFVEFIGGMILSCVVGISPCSDQRCC
jgi:hypothetical protein